MNADQDHLTTPTPSSPVASHPSLDPQLLAAVAKVLGHISSADDPVHSEVSTVKDEMSRRSSASHYSPSHHVLDQERANTLTLRMMTPLEITLCVFYHSI
jgi:hypothetical protein